MRLLATLAARDAEIDFVVKRVPYNGGWLPVTFRDMLAARDARLAALSRENAAMRDIVAAVATAVPYYAEANGGWECMHCHVWRAEDWLAWPGDGGLEHYQHKPDCPVTRARALLAMQAPGTTGATAGEEGE